MATARDTVTRSLRMIGAVEAGETPSAEDATDALQILNDMLHGWAKEGVDLGHITMALTDTHKTHDSCLEGIRYNLAVRLGPEWGRPVPTLVAMRARQTFKAFQAATHEYADDLRVDRALDARYFGRRRGTYDIDEG